MITEIGGTIGDIESQPFLEAIRQVGHEVGKENRLYIHVTLVPYLKASGEHKSKPTQHSVKELQGWAFRRTSSFCARTSRSPIKLFLTRWRISATCAAIV